MAVRKERKPIRLIMTKIIWRSMKPPARYSYSFSGYSLRPNDVR